MAKGYYETELEKVGKSQNWKENPYARIKVYGEKGESRFLTISKKEFDGIKKVMQKKDKSEFMSGEQNYDFSKSKRN